MLALAVIFLFFCIAIEAYHIRIRYPSKNSLSRLRISDENTIEVETNDDETPVVTPELAETPGTGPCPNFYKCSGIYRDKGCDGNGKIQGGIATVPLLSWWPIKVYRPCPSFLQAGYAYRREGQTLEQVLFSEPSNKMKQKMEEQRLQKVSELTPPTPEEMKAKEIVQRAMKKREKSNNEE